MSVGFIVLGRVPDVDLSGSRVQGIYGDCKAWSRNPRTMR